MRREALAEAERIRLEADEDAAKIREGADHYADQVLTRIEADLQGLANRVTESQQIVRNGQRILGQVKRHGNLGAASLPLTATVTNAQIVTGAQIAPVSQQLSSPLLSPGGRVDYE